MYDQSSFLRGWIRRWEGHQLFFLLILWKRVWVWKRIGILIFSSFTIVLFSQSELYLSTLNCYRYCPRTLVFKREIKSEDDEGIKNHSLKICISILPLENVIWKSWKENLDCAFLIKGNFCTFSQLWIIDEKIKQF